MYGKAIGMLGESWRVSEGGVVGWEHFWLGERDLTRRTRKGDWSWFGMTEIFWRCLRGHGGAAVLRFYTNPLVGGRLGCRCNS